MKATKRLIHAMTAALLAGSSITPALASDGGWDWKLVSYVWASDIQTDLKARGQPVEGQVDFSDIVDKLDYSLQMHFEGQGDQFGFFADLTYLALSDKKAFTQLDAKVSLDTTIFEVAGVWSPGQERYRGFEAFAGLRVLDTKLDARFIPVDPAIPTERRIVDGTLTDAMIGARYIAKLSDKWHLTVRGDVSFGDTEGTYNGSAIFNYQLKKGALILGYRYMAIDLEQGSGETATMTMLGPVIGYARSF